jgi:hypothetical protein
MCTAPGPLHAQQTVRCHAHHRASLQVALDHNQHDAAFEIYRKGNHRVEALCVLTDRAKDLNRAHEYATKVDDPLTWSTLGHKQLEQGHVTDAIGSYLLAKDSSKYLEVIAKAKQVKQYDDLVKYLMMVRDKVKDPKVDTEIVIAYAMTDKLGDLESFITSVLSVPSLLLSPCAPLCCRHSWQNLLLCPGDCAWKMGTLQCRAARVCARDTGVPPMNHEAACHQTPCQSAGPNQANVQECGNRAYEEARFEAARILYLNVKNFGRLASCLVHLSRFNEAVDAARKANTPQTWKEVCFACVDVKEFKLAQLCGLNIITSTDELNEARLFISVIG